MRNRVRLAATFSGLAVAALALSGCVQLPMPQAQESSAPVEEIEATEPVETEDAGDDAPATELSGDVTAPGTVLGAGEWATYEFTGTEDEKALISARLVSVEPATSAQLDLLVSEIPDLKGWKVVLIHAEQQKVSGDPVKFNSDYSYFSPATAAGSKAQNVYVIGWDECATESFTEEFDNGATIEQCFVGAYVDGGEPVTGMLYEGGYEEGNPYDSYDGQPIVWKQ